MDYPETKPMRCSKCRKVADFDLKSMGALIAGWDLRCPHCNRIVPADGWESLSPQQKDAAG